ncbi:MAG: xylulose kinase [Acidobacteriia bacterium]|nr:xylulose kinase [Terriglobia bacterium]
MQKDCLIGVDLGTTLAKAGVYDVAGNLLGEACVETEVRYPRAGLAEQDPGEFYRSTIHTIRGALEKSRLDSARVAALSVSSQAGGIMAIDRSWQPVTHFDSPLDTRSNVQKQRMMTTAGNRIIALAGTPPTYGQKILWWKGEHPEVWKRVHKFIQPSAYVTGLMTGLTGEQAYMEPSFICWSGLSDTANLRWSEELCEIFQIPMQVLPRIAPAGQVAGYLTAEAARDFGLASGLPVAVGTADAAATLLGAGVVDPGGLFDISGTACIFGVCADQFRADPATGTLSCMSSALPGKFYLLSIVLGGETHGWFIREFCGAEAQEAAQKGISVFDLMDSKAKSLPPGSEGVLCVPQLGGRWNPPEPDVRGLWIGFGWGHRKEHLYRAILESVAYEYTIYLTRMRELIPHADLQEVRVMSGGGRSRLWNRIKCDVLGIPYRKLTREDLATWGSALIAGHAVGIFPDLALAAKASVGAGQSLEPNNAAHLAYRAYGALYPRLIESNRSAFGALAEISSQPG